MNSDRVSTGCRQRKQVFEGTSDSKRRRKKQEDSCAHLTPDPLASRCANQEPEKARVRARMRGSSHVLRYGGAKGLISVYSLASEVDESVTWVTRDDTTGQLNVLHDAG
jgi:hypothetical protein